jgi:uncharacterized HAD superfamily protein
MKALKCDEVLLATITEGILAIANMPDSKIKLLSLENKVAVSCDDVNDLSDFLQELSENISFQLLRINKVAKRKARKMIVKIKNPTHNNENIYCWNWLTIK